MSAVNRLPQGDVSTKEYIMSVNRIHLYSVKIHNYKNVDTVMLTVSSIQSADVLLLCYMWLCEYEHVVSKFSVQKF
jgi:hypothetical protein